MTRNTKLFNDKNEIEQKEIIYDGVSVSICRDEEPLTAQQARDLLGWEVESAGDNWGKDYFLKDSMGKKVRCHNNLINVPYYPRNMDEILQEIVRVKSDGSRAWNFNAEPIIVGKFGSILNGQHTLIALVLAAQKFESDPDSFPDLEEEPTIDKLVVFGIDEDDDTVNSLDTCRGRNQSDVFYRSELFAHIVTTQSRKAQSKIASYAVNTLWDRLGAEDAFAPRQTFSAAIEFLKAHPRLLQAVEFISVENGAENAIGRYLSLGSAAGMLYLMGCSNTSVDEYILDPQESSLDWSNWSKACDYFELIGSDAKEIQPLKKALQKLYDEDGGNRREKMAIVVKGWLQWVEHGKIGLVELDYLDRDGVKILDESPNVGGIDQVEHRI